MGTVRNLSFDDGRVAIKINNDPNRVIHINPGDMNITTRYNEMIKKLNDMKVDNKPVDDETELEAADRTLRDVENVLREQINYLLNEDCYDTIFGGQSPLSICGKNLLCENVINALGDMIGDVLGKSVDTLELKMKKYTAKYQLQDHKAKGTK